MDQDDDIRRIFALAQFLNDWPVDPAVKIHLYLGGHIILVKWDYQLRTWRQLRLDDIL